MVADGREKEGVERRLLADNECRCGGETVAAETELGSRAKAGRHTFLHQVL